VVQFLRHHRDEVSGSSAALAADAQAPVVPARGRSWALRAGHAIFRHRDWVFPLVLLALGLAFAPAPPLGHWEWDPLVDAIGIALAVSGQALRAVVIGLAYIRRGGKDKTIYADALVTEGVFAHSRNPLYVGNLLVLFGLFVIHGSPWVLLLGGAFFGTAYVLLVLSEEDYLRTRFGAAFDDYCRRVNRFLPSPRGFRDTVRGMRFDWARLVRKEYSSTFAWTSGAIALLAWEHLRQPDAAPRREIVVVALVAWLPIVIAWAAARIAKKTGALGHG
jgi:protein-S-isoprenylcysteine O-methyltransferase Ste14